tara:strand:- start:6739 stop:8478 length:1740 start_codon:yes stop_codon:yes gene_type:complete
MKITMWLILTALILPLFGFLFAGRRRSSNMFQHFTAGKSSPWFLLGCSAAVTSISSDTPVLVAGAFYQNGIAGNWFWLAGVPGALATLIFFANLWRRSGVLTAAELIPLRYGDSHPINATYRKLNALLDAGICNVLVLTSVIYAFLMLLTLLLEQTSLPAGFSVGLTARLCTALVILVVIIYTLRSGFKAVIRTDLIQFVVVLFISISVCIGVLWTGLNDFGNWRNLTAQLPDRHQWFSPGTLTDHSFWLLALFGWWYIAPGSGLFVQRLIAARNEYEASLTSLTYIIIHYVLRVWPWFIVGALALVYLPDQHHNEFIYFDMAREIMPGSGIILLLVAFIASFMSTLDSRLNWAASYFVNDICYQHIDRRKHWASIVERASIIGLITLAFVIALSDFAISIIGIYKLLFTLQAGRSVAVIARWYWWRMTIYAELAAMLSSLICGAVLFCSMNTDQQFALMITINMAISGCVTVITAALTSRHGPAATDIQFQRQTRVTGPGWNRVTRHNSLHHQPHGLRHLVTLWLLSIVVIYSLFSLIAAVLMFSTLAISISAMLLILSAWFIYQITSTAKFNAVVSN